MSKKKKEKKSQRHAGVRLERAQTALFFNLLSATPIFAGEKAKVTVDRKAGPINDITFDELEAEKVDD